MTTTTITHFGTSADTLIGDRMPGNWQSGGIVGNRPEPSNTAVAATIRPATVLRYGNEQSQPRTQSHHAAMILRWLSNGGPILHELPNLPGQVRPGRGQRRNGQGANHSPPRGLAFCGDCWIAHTGGWYEITALSPASGYCALTVRRQPSYSPTEKGTHHEQGIKAVAGIGGRNRNRAGSWVSAGTALATGDIAGYGYARHCCGLHHTEVFDLLRFYNAHRQQVQMRQTAHVTGRSPGDCRHHHNQRVLDACEGN